MKYLKKTTALLLSVLLLFSAMVTGVTVTAEGNTATITVTSVEDVAGANVDVPVKITTTGVLGLDFEVNSELEVNSYTIGENFEEVYPDEDFYNNSKQFVLLAKGTEDVAGEDVVVLTLNVAIPADAEEAATYNITLSNAVVTNYAEEDIVTATNDGSVTVKAATPDVPECEHEWEVVSATAAQGTGTNAGSMVTTTPGSIDFVCALCGEENHVDDVQYWSRHTFYKQNLSIATQIELVFNLRDDRYNDSTLGAAEDGFASITVIGADETVTTYPDLTGLEVTNLDGRNVRKITAGLAAKQMTDDVVANTFIKVDGVWYSGYAVTKSVRDLTDDRMTNGATGAEATLYADLLNFGSLAQQYFTYRTDELANADFTNYESHVTTASLTFEDNIEQTYLTEGAANYVFNNKYGLTLAARTEARIFVRTNKSGTTVDHVTAKLTYGEGDDAVVTNITPADMSVDPDNPTSTNRYWFRYVDVLPKCMRDTVTLIYYIDGEYANNTVTFSIEDIVANRCATPGVSEMEISMYEAMMKYADAAKAYLS